MVSQVLEPETVSELFRCALCHDQCAFACPLVRVSRSTLAYPSRLAQVALAASRGEIPPEALGDSLDFCIDCGLCQEWCVYSGNDPGPPDISANLATTRHALGLIRQYTAGDRSIPMDLVTSDNPDYMLVVGSELLAGSPDSVAAAARLLTRAGARFRPVVTPSLASMQSAGHWEELETELAALQTAATAAQCDSLVCTSPRDTLLLRSRFPSVEYAGDVIAERWSDPPPRQVVGPLFLYPSSSLLRKLGVGRLDRFLQVVFGEAYLPLPPDAKSMLLPAAAEFPTPGISEEYLEGLASEVWNRIYRDRASPPRRSRDATPAEEAQDSLCTILTTDPYTRARLESAARGRADIVDLFCCLANNL